MGKLSVPARTYILSMMLAGLICLAITLPNWDWQHTWIATIVLSVLGTLTLLFKVDGTTVRTHYNFTFLIYGISILLFGVPVALIVILVAHLLEQIKNKYVWYIQAFNIASYIVVAAASTWVYTALNPSQTFESQQSIAAILVALAFFTLLNHLLVGIVVWLARGENFKQSGIFAFFTLMLDWVMLCMGAGIAVVLKYNPYAAILVLVPLYLIYNTLRVPALERQTESDLKTGLYNHKYLMDSLANELKRVRRFERPLTIVMGDLDLLRNINNTYGHVAGDEVLIGVARILREKSREFDVVARFGGEEFGIMMRETTPEEAYQVVERFRMEIEKTAFTVPTSVTPIKATMSFGVAGFEPGLDEKMLIHNADLALYHAKIKGRNRAFIYSEEGFQDLFISPLDQNTVTSYPLAEKAARAAQAVVTAQADAPLPSPQPEQPAIAPEEYAKPLHTPRKNARRWVNLYVGAVTLSALGLLLLGLRQFPALDWLGILVFACLIVATERGAIDIYVRKSAVSTSAVPLIAAVLLFGPAGAVATSLAIAIVAYFRHRSPINRLIFNFGNHLFASMASLLLIQLAGSTFSEWTFLVQLLVTTLVTMLVFLLTSLFISIGVTLDTGDPIQVLWKEQFGWLIPYYLGMGVIAFSVIFSYLHFGIYGIIVVLVPLILTRISQKQFIDRTTAAVKELNEKNKILEDHSSEITRLNDGLLDTLAEVIDLRDPSVLGHSQRVTYYAVLIAEEMGLAKNQIEVIRKSSLMHDLGKLGIQSVLLKKPSSLTREEYKIVQQHVTVGADLLQKSQVLRSLIPIVLHHHEWYDGGGYPGKLKGKDIPLEARIVGLADAVEAMASDRPYRKALSFNTILEEVKRCAGSQFDPEVAAAFIRIAVRKGPGLVVGDMGSSHLEEMMNLAAVIQDGLNQNSLGDQPASI